MEQKLNKTTKQKITHICLHEIDILIEREREKKKEEYLNKKFLNI